MEKKYSELERKCERIEEEKSTCKENMVKILKEYTKYKEAYNDEMVSGLNSKIKELDLNNQEKEAKYLQIEEELNIVKMSAQSYRIDLASVQKENQRLLADLNKVKTSYEETLNTHEKVMQEKKHKIETLKSENLTYKVPQIDIF